MYRPTLGAVALWLPGDFLGTNKLLDLQRASGFYAGVARASKERQRPARVSFASETRRIREYTAARARERRLVVMPPVGLWFGLLGSGRLDPDAWYLPGKAVTDGLVDAGVILSDRSNVAWTGGRCFASHREADERLSVYHYRDTRGGGLLVEIAEGADRGNA